MRYSIFSLACFVLSTSASVALSAATETPADVVRSIVQAATMSAADDDLAARFFSRGFGRDRKTFFQHSDCGPWSGNLVAGGQGIERLNVVSIAEKSRTGSTSVVDATITATMEEDEGGTTGKPFAMMFILLKEDGLWKIDEFIAPVSDDGPTGSTRLSKRISAASHTFFRAMNQYACTSNDWPK